MVLLERDDLFACWAWALPVRSFFTSDMRPVCVETFDEMLRFQQPDHFVHLLHLERLDY